MKAVILAAGEGTRLEPLTELRPKPMLPIANKPLLEHVLESVVEAGVEEVVFVVGYKRERIQDHFGDGDAWGVDITYAVQDPPRGTGDALLQAEPYIGEDFIALNGDRIIEADAIQTVMDRRRETGDVCLAVTRVADPTLYGVVELDGEEVTAIREKPPAHLVTSDLINAGVYGFGPDVFAAIRETETHGELALTDTLTNLMASRRVCAVRFDGPWLDVTYPWDLVAVNASVLDRDRAGFGAGVRIDEDATLVDPVAVAENVHVAPGARVLGGSAVGGNVTIGPNAVVSNSVLFPDVTVGAGAVVKDCVVGENATVGPQATIEGGRTAVVLGDTVYRDVKFGGIVGDSADLAGAVTVTPGTVVGNRTVVGSGALVSGRIATDAEVRRG